MDPTARLEPFAPFVIDVSLIDEIAAMQEEAGVRRRTIRLTNDARPVFAEIVLGVAEEDEREGFGLIAGGREHQPFAPRRAVADAVAVLGSRLQVLEGGGMKVGGDRVQFERLADRRRG